MPPLPDPPNPTLRTTINWKVGADPMGGTRFFWEYSGGAPSSTNCATLAGVIQAEAISDFVPLMHPQISIESVDVVDITTTSGKQGSASTPTPGTRTGGQLAPGTAVLVNHTIGTRYRGGKPRSYFPFGTSTDVGTTGLWDTSFTTAVDNAFALFISNLTGAVGGSTAMSNYIALSYYDGVNPPVTLPSGRVKQSSKVRTVPVQYDITGHTTSVVIASQRRRNRNA